MTGAKQGDGWTESRVALTPIEYNILRLLMTHPGQVVFLRPDL